MNIVTPLGRAIAVLGIAAYMVAVYLSEWRDDELGGPLVPKALMLVAVAALLACRQMTNFVPYEKPDLSRPENRKFVTAYMLVNTTGLLLVVLAVFIAIFEMAARLGHGLRHVLMVIDLLGIVLGAALLAASNDTYNRKYVFPSASASA
jgi:hypothetical protein